MMANERGSRVAVVHGCFPEGGDSILSAFSWEPLHRCQVSKSDNRDNLRFASAKIVNHTPFSASGGVASYYAASKNRYTKGSVLKTVPKATFFASTRLRSFLSRQKMPSI